MTPLKWVSCSVFLLLGAFVFVSTPAYAQTVWINEVHYDNVGADADEGVEIAGPAGTDLTGWRVRLYNGTNGTAYGVVVLSGTIPNLCDDGYGNQYGAIWFPEVGMQNGSPDGMALVDDNGSVLQFLSYEGIIGATDMEANGMTSSDIGIVEDGTTPVGYSLQLVGHGSQYSAFTWAMGPSSHSSCNSGQTTAVGDTPKDPFAISSYPNPFNPETTIEYSVPSRGEATVAVYDARGAHIATLVNDVVGEGAHLVRWSGTDASGRNVGSGVYFARVAHGGAVRVEKLVLLK